MSTFPPPVVLGDGTRVQVAAYTEHSREAQITVNAGHGLHFSVSGITHAELTSLEGQMQSALHELEETK